MMGPSSVFASKQQQHKLMRINSLALAADAVVNSSRSSSALCRGHVDPLDTTSRGFLPKEQPARRHGSCVVVGNSGACTVGRSSPMPIRGRGGGGGGGERVDGERERQTKQQTKADKQRQLETCVCGGGGGGRDR